MEDKQIVDLYFARNESAIRETEKKYGALCRYIASNFLALPEDRDECVNDVLLALWNTIPPERPTNLPGYISEVTRRQAVNKSRANNAWKRGGGIQTVNEEFLSLLEDGTDLAEQYEAKRAGELISRYLRTLPPEPRNLFVGRYYFMDSIKEIAGYYGMTESKVKTTLHRTRKGLRQYLIKEGFEV